MAMLDRVLRRDPAGQDDIEASRMTILEHLEALRRVLIVSMIAWGLCTAVAFFFWQPLLQFLIARGGVQKPTYLTPTGVIPLELMIAPALVLVRPDPLC